MLNLVLITDNKYSYQTMIALTSIIMNKNKDSQYKIFVLANALHQENKDLIKSCEAEKTQIEIIDCENYINQFKEVIQSRHVTYTALLKFYLPEIFKDLDKILYMDSDVIVQGDLNDFYNTDITGYYSTCTIDIQNYKIKHLKRIKHCGKRYFNSGVLLLNLDLLRKENVSQKLVENKLEYPDTGFMDQDTFNMVFVDKVKYISYKYNFLPELTKWVKIEDFSDYFGESVPKDMDEICETCLILHLGGKLKPWVYDLGNLSDKYRYYWEQSPVREPFPELPPPPKKSSRRKYTFWEKIFSIKSDSNFKYKVLTILGIRIKYKRRNIDKGIS